MKAGLIGAAGALVVLGGGGAADAETFDTIIRGGTIVDGSGLAPYAGDVAIRGKHIVAVGKLPRGAKAATVIEAKGLIVAPGFINIHSHAQPNAVASAVNMLTQGVTTEITNADGGGTTDITAQLKTFSAGGLAENIGLYIGFNATWTAVIGTDDRRATPAEIERMRGIVTGNLAQGAWGVAAGLDYKPAYFADVEDVIAVVSAARPWRTNFPNHDRIKPEQNYSSFAGIAETVTIGERAGLAPVITHMKTQGAEQENAAKVLALLEAATARGVYTAADLYPYLAGQSGLSLNVPGWAQAGGREAMLKRFADPATRARIIDDIEGAMNQRWGGPKGVYLLSTGQELTEVIAPMNVRPGEAVVRLLEKQEHGAIFRFGAESDVRAFLAWRDAAMSCDCGATIGDKVHPRTWGSFPRVLGTYVRDDGVLTMPDAIRKMSALPATIIGMTDRGYLAAGMVADVAVFDPRTVGDRATYESPTLPSVGFRHVLVNGKVALRDGAATGEKGGEVVLRTSHMPTRPMTAATAARGLAGSGELGGLRVEVDAVQAAGAAAARGRLRLVDGGRTWTSDGLGQLQTAPGWASLTATLTDGKGGRRAATLTMDAGDATAGAARPVLVLRLDGGPELVGSWRGRD